VEILEYDERRWEELQAFFRVMNQGIAREPDVFRWKYLKAPAARRGVNQFLTVIDQGEIAGTLGFTECPVYVHGQKLVSCAFNDWYILPRMRLRRRSGMALTSCAASPIMSSTWLRCARLCNARGAKRRDTEADDARE